MKRSYRLNGWGWTRRGAARPVVVAAAAGLLLAVSTPAPSPAASPEPVAIVDSLEGEPIVVRAGADLPEELALHAPLFIDDIVETDEDSLLGLVFIDDTTITLGEDSTVEINEFLYDAESQTRTALFTFSDGIIKVAVDTLLPDSTFEVQTSTTVASVRATEWIAEAEPATTAIVTLWGSVAVRSSDPAIAGEVVLGQGEGIQVGLGEAPSSKQIWDQDRVAEYRGRTSVK